jgi:hypothetical protein
MLLALEDCHKNAAQQLGLVDRDKASSDMLKL